ncbi:MAG: OadG family protein [Desulforhopalus sp.]
MTVTDLLANFANPEIMQSLSTTDKLYAGLITTVLGMGITFTALIILQFVIAWMDKILNKSKKDQASATSPVPPEETRTASEPEVQEDDTELIAVIATAIAMQMRTSVDNIVIRNIEKVADHSPAWNRAGIAELMNSRF